jgi:hypothetical protein
MRIELVVVSGCPHADAAGELLAQALEDIGLGSRGYTVVVVDSEAEARQRRFVGSPTFAIDGEDVFAEPGHAVALACRVYGSGAVPGLRELRQALKRAAAMALTR